MNRSDVMSRISTIARQNPSACLWALAYLLGDRPAEVLQEVLDGLEEYIQPARQPGHYEAYRERWGRIPDEQ